MKSNDQQTDMPNSQTKEDQQSPYQLFRSNYQEYQSEISFDFTFLSTQLAQQQPYIKQSIKSAVLGIRRFIDQMKKYIISEMDDFEYQLYPQSQMSPIGSILDQQQNQIMDQQLKQQNGSTHSIDSLPAHEKSISKSVNLRSKAVGAQQKSKSMVKLASNY